MDGEFDYEAALRRLIDLRFEARQKGIVSTPEIRDLQARIYAHVRRNRAAYRHAAPAPRPASPASAEQSRSEDAQDAAPSGPGTSGLDT